MKSELKPAPELRSVFETCHNCIYANEGLLKEKVFNEVLKLIFRKNEQGEVIKNKDEEPVIDTDIPEIIEAFNEFKRKLSLGF